MKSVALHNLGCKVNGYEMDFMQQTLEEQGYRIVPFDAKADIYVINTCTVTNVADKKSRQMIHRARKQNPDAIVVAVGCYVQVGDEEILKDKGIDLAIGNNKKKDLAAILGEFIRCREQGNTFCDKTLSGETIIDIGHTGEFESMQLKGTGKHTRAFIKVQDGCDQFCSYCIIPYARGRIRSRQAEEVVEEVKALSKNGYREIVLTGIHLSSYGMESASGEDFSQSKLLSLIQEAAKVPGIERIRLGSLEPRIITSDFAKGLAGCKKLCPHFHLSLQSGSDSVLKRMNRKYTSEEYYEKVCVLREYFKDPAITTDVIVGFPGESPQEFEETVKFLEKTEFYEMHIFKYSMRKGTLAAAMEGQVEESVKGERSAVLMELEAEMSKRYRERFLHKEVEVLFEEDKVIDGKIYQVGHTREYIRVACESGQRLSGKIMPITPSRFLQDDLLQ
ncbi:MAG: tRNA (N(6)-L-threonylcarbamoyladenosine(37)-C(2))-methylthiotransferase MtaB [Lachnospiraceae bacterium]|nr:tRNA (N(6)-L-threonylcarbamoyladenosine(37)-C(2))-methylthiotransferase MtaB [Lachnospiraceae bacterium]